MRLVISPKVHFKIDSLLINTCSIRHFINNHRCGLSIIHLDVAFEVKCKGYDSCNISKCISSILMRLK